MYSCNVFFVFLFSLQALGGWGFSLQHTGRKKTSKLRLYSTSSSCVQDKDEMTSVSYKILKENHILCPPLPLQSLHLHEEMHPLKALPDLSITRLSLDPNVFLLKNFLSLPEEQIAMIMSAVNQGMDYSGTSSGDVVSQRFKSYTSWVYPEGRDVEDNDSSTSSTESIDDDVNKPLGIDEDANDFQRDGRKVARYMTELTAFLFFPDHFSSGSDDDNDAQFLSKNNGSSSAIAEAIQVVRYEVGGKYDMHHDGYNRFLTVLCYLNGIAGTWFPYAVVDRKEYEKIIGESYEDIPDFTMDTVAKDKTPGKDGLLVVGLEYEKLQDIEDNPHIVRINPGDAIAFYSYDWIETYYNNDENNSNFSNREDNPPPTGPFMNYRSLHTGMTTKKAEKWIATNWFRISNDES